MPKLVCNTRCVGNKKSGPVNYYAGMVYEFTDSELTEMITDNAREQKKGKTGILSKFDYTEKKPGPGRPPSTPSETTPAGTPGA
jgi:hypothetical protein